VKGRRKKTEAEQASKPGTPKRGNSMFRDQVSIADPSNRRLRARQVEKQ
jgi:hypothetical protein